MSGDPAEGDPSQTSIARAVVGAIDRLQARIGSLCAWATLGMVVVTFAIVVLRYLFNSGWIWMQEIVLYLHSAVFLGASGYALSRDQHVRIDILYQRFSPVGKAWVNLLGTAFLLVPTAALVWVQAFPFVRASWEILEASQESGGLPTTWAVKTLILAYSSLLALQALALFARSLSTLISGPTGDPRFPEPTPESRGPVG